MTQKSFATEEEIILLKKIVDAINKEVDALKSNA